MYIACKNNHGTKWLALVENCVNLKTGKRSQKTVENIGALTQFDDGKPDYLPRLRESFNVGTPLIPTLNKYATKKVLPKFKVPKNIGYFILDALYNELGIQEVLTLAKSRSKIEYDLNGLAKLLIFGRILDPASKSATYEQNSNYLFPVAKLDKNLFNTDNGLHLVYKALSVLSKKQIAIQTRMNKKIMDNLTRNTENLYYDVTNYYFEIEFNDNDILDEQGNRLKEGLRKKGVSKEHRPNPIVQMGLLMDGNGLPISYQIFPGNHLDTTTLRPFLENAEDNFEYGKVVVVADRGLNSDKNIASLKENGNGYIFSKSIKKNKQIVRDWILDETGYKDNDGNVPNAESNFKIKSRIVERSITSTHGKKITIKEKQVAFWSRKHYLHEMKRNAKFMDYLDKVIEFPDKLKDKQSKLEYFLKIIEVDAKTGEEVKTKKIRQIDMVKVREFIDLMGYYLICTSEIEMSDREIINKYHGLSRIEDSFRIIKSELNARPVYVRTPEHINAHFLICFIALTMIRLLQFRVLQSIGKSTQTDGWIQGITANKLCKGLRSWQVILSDGNYDGMYEPTDEIKKLLQVLGVENDTTNLKQLKYSIERAKVMYVE
jgi:transposase